MINKTHKTRLILNVQHLPFGVEDLPERTDVLSVKKYAKICHYNLNTFNSDTWCLGLTCIPDVLSASPLVALILNL